MSETIVGDRMIYWVKVGEVARADIVIGGNSTDMGQQ